MMASWKYHSPQTNIYLGTKIRVHIFFFAFVIHYREFERKKKVNQKTKTEQGVFGVDSKNSNKKKNNNKVFGVHYEHPIMYTKPNQNFIAIQKFDNFTTPHFWWQA